MIDYQLAKELKEAGFERKSVPRDFQPFGQPITDEEYINVLTLTSLSELIEACGEEFWGVTLLHLEGEYKGKWKADACIPGKTLYVLGKTPEEAVARLWLALNEKK